MPKKKIGLDLSPAVGRLTARTKVKKGLVPVAGAVLGTATAKLWNAILRGDDSWRDSLDRDNRNSRYDRRDG